MRVLPYRYLLTLVGMCSIFSECIPFVFAEEAAFPGKQSEFHGFTQYDFQVDGYEFRVVEPEQAAPGRPWVWRAQFWGHEPQLDVALLKCGFHIAHAAVGNVMGAPEALLKGDRLYAYLTQSHGLSRKVVLEGMSRGGLLVYNWAAKNPEKVACIYADNPVCDFKSWPAGKGKGKGSPNDWAKCLKAYELTEAQALEYTGNPVDNLEPLARAEIPLIHVVGEADQVVPVAENTNLIEDRYRALGGYIEVIRKEGSGHHPHSLKDPVPLVNFILKATGEPASPGQSIQKRTGLRNCAQVFSRTGKGSVAFIGGSITEMNGYRPRVENVLRTMYPDTAFDFNNAGISSTGSTTGAFRLPTDVLSRGKVDLLFVEFAVNDNQDALREHNRMILAMEGMVRQARRHNPYIDIVFLYTGNENHIASYQAGQVPHEIAQHEIVAEHYGIPSISLAADVARRMARGEFDWKKFGGTHPAPFGAELYKENIQRLLRTACVDQGQPVAHSVPLPMEVRNYEQGRFLDIGQARIESGWTVGTPDWANLAGKTRQQFAGIPMLCADRPGATLHLQYTGSAVGMFLVSGPDAGVIEYSLDGGEFKTIDLFTQYSRGLHYPWTCMFASDLLPGPHTLTLRVSKQKNPASRGTAVRIKTFVVN